MTLTELNNLNPDEAFNAFFNCCGSTSWATQLIRKRPFKTLEDILQHSDAIWLTCSQQDAFEAFSHHPKIGDLKNLETKFSSTKEWAGNEQLGVNTATHNILIALAEGNKIYEDKFGYIFIVCATGKTAEEMLALLNMRLVNAPETEIKIAMKEQNKITHLRIEKLLA
jgi:2-oxo-4-hydroxy-4-carboxy-5-ureidoimidazoline decarboxylase